MKANENGINWTPVIEFYTYLVNPAISTAYQLDENSSLAQRLEMAHCFLSSKEYQVAVRPHIDFFTTIENVLKSKVLTYAIAFAGGAVNGGMLYQNARADLMTWRSIFEGATFVNGWLQ